MAVTFPTEELLRALVPAFQALCQEDDPRKPLAESLGRIADDVPLDCDEEDAPDCRAINRQVLANLRRFIVDVGIYEHQLPKHTHHTLLGAIADIVELVAHTDALIASEDNN